MEEKIKEVFHLFATPVGIVDLRGPTPAEMEFMNSLEKRKNWGNMSSVDTHILEREEMSDLRDMIKEMVDEFFDGVFEPDGDLKLRFTQSWVNYSDSDHYHPQHAHANAAISGVYYPCSEAEGDQINFYSPLRPYQRLELVSRTDNPNTAQGFTVGAMTGRLVLFPSYLEHAVPKIEARKKTRVSLSFNTFYEGTLGSEQTLTELKV